MYKIGVIVNENEVSHSKYANTIDTLRKAIDDCNLNGKKGNSYYFKEFDKFNIQSLFDEGENNIKTFDGIVISTNAMDNDRIYNVFLHYKNVVEEFINDNRGIFISSQKKLSNGSLTSDKFQSTGFLPEIYDYYIFDRPEKYSSEGNINLASDNKILFYPNSISKELIENHCEKNEFIVHRYRSIIIPKHPNAFETLLNDIDIPISKNELGYSNDERKVLLTSKYNRRIVLSTMVLDWANHKELLCNILIFITENKPPAFFVKKDSESSSKSSVIESYIIRANIANLPYRVISEHEIMRYSNFTSSTYIFSQKWSTKEIERKYNEMLFSRKEYFSIYHISKSGREFVNDLKLSKYCNFSSIDRMKDEVIQRILSEYISNSWHKSVWTYSYVINLIKFFDVNIPIIANSIYEELIKHFTKKDEHNGVVELVGSYDNVFNATCKMAEILNYFQDKYSEIVNKDSNYKIDNVLKQTDKWLLCKITGNSISDQDICYGFLYLLSCGGYKSTSDSIKTRLILLVDKILSETFLYQQDEIATIDLCRIYQVTCRLVGNGAFTDKKYFQYIKRLETVLSQRQDIYGNWKNISETSEIVVMLMDVYKIRSSIDCSLNVINEVITKAVEILHSNFDSIFNSFDNDLNTIAKAMNGIGAYNEIFNFAINDFFLDLNHHQTNVSNMSGTDIAIIDGFYKKIDELEKEKVQLTKKNVDNENMFLSVQKKLARAKLSSLIAVLMLLSLLFLSAILLKGLLSNHKEILYEIFARYKEAFIGGFIGLGLTIVWELIFNRLKKE